MWHRIMLFIYFFRWKKKESKKREGLMDTPDHLEYVEMWFMKKQNISLPGVCFVLVLCLLSFNFFLFNI